MLLEKLMGKRQVKRLNGLIVLILRIFGNDNRIHNSP